MCWSRHRGMGAFMRLDIRKEEDLRGYALASQGCAKSAPPSERSAFLYCRSVHPVVEGGRCSGGATFS
jgi:hypothetical protein